MFSLWFMCNIIIIIMCTCIYTDNNNLHNVDSLSKLQIGIPRTCTGLTISGATQLS